jgi:hypothetical protein
MVLLGSGPEGPGSASAHRGYRLRAAAFRRGRVRGIGSVWSEGCVGRASPEGGAVPSARSVCLAAPEGVVRLRTWLLLGWSRGTAWAGSTRWRPRGGAAPPCPAAFHRRPEGLRLRLASNRVPSASHPEGCAASGCLRSGAPEGVPVLRLDSVAPRGYRVVPTVCLRRGSCRRVALGPPPKGWSRGRAIFPGPKTGLGRPLPSTLRRVPLAACPLRSPKGAMLAGAALPSRRRSRLRRAASPEGDLASTRPRHRFSSCLTLASPPEGGDWPRWPKPAGFPAPKRGGSPPAPKCRGQRLPRRSVAAARRSPKRLAESIVWPAPRRQNRGSEDSQPPGRSAEALFPGPRPSLFSRPKPGSRRGDLSPPGPKPVWLEVR